MRLGFQGKLYLNTNLAAGAYAAPAWTSADNVKDLTLNLEKGEWDASTRGTGGFKAAVGTLIDAAIEFDIVYVPTDPVFAQLLNSFLAHTPIDCLCLDGDVATVGNQGLRAWCEVMKFPLDQKLEEGMKLTVTMKPTLAANAPVWFVVPAH